MTVASSLRFQNACFSPDCFLSPLECTNGPLTRFKKQDLVPLAGYLRPNRCDRDAFEHAGLADAGRARLCSSLYGESVSCFYQRSLRSSVCQLLPKQPTLKTSTALASNRTANDYGGLEDPFGEDDNDLPGVALGNAGKSSQALIAALQRLDVVTAVNMRRRGSVAGLKVIQNENGAAFDIEEFSREDASWTGGPNGAGSGRNGDGSMDSPTITGREPVYQVVEINSQGKLTKRGINRRLLLRSSGLRPRDLRRIDPSLWVTNSLPAILVRNHAILLNLGSLRAIATPDCVQVFDSESTGARAFLDVLRQRLDVENASSSGHPMSLELEAVEAALISRTCSLEAALMEVEPRVVELLEHLPNRLTAHALEELRLSKQALVELGSKAGALRQMLLELLEDSDRIRRMTSMGRLCRVHRGSGILECETGYNEDMAEAEEEEVEMLLEYYLQRCDSCHGQAEKLLDSAKEMEDSIAVNLSSRRLEVNRLELLLAIGTFAAAIGAMVAGIFGMNLTSYLETHSNAFWYTAGGIIVGGIIMFYSMYSHLKRRKIL